MLLFLAEMHLLKQVCASLFKLQVPGRNRIFGLLWKNCVVHNESNFKEMTIICVLTYFHFSQHTIQYNENLLHLFVQIERSNYLIRSVFDRNSKLKLEYNMVKQIGKVAKNNFFQKQFVSSFPSYFISEVIIFAV